LKKTTEKDRRRRRRRGRRIKDLKYLKIIVLLTNIFLENKFYFTLNAAINVMKRKVKK